MLCPLFKQEFEYLNILIFIGDGECFRLGAGR